MNESHSYLHLLLHEPIYVIPDATTTKVSTITVEPQPSTATTAATPVPPVAPSPLKPLAIFIDIVDFKSLPESQQTMLNKLLQAAKVDINSAEFLPNQDFAPAVALYEKCLVFNSALGQAKYSLIQHAQSQVLIADSLSSLENNVELKRQLWPQVQKLFGLV